MTRERRIGVVVVAVAVLVLAGATVVPLSALWLLMVVTAIGLVTYVAASIALEEHRGLRSSADLARRTREQRRSESSRALPSEVVSLVAEGARTDREVAEALGEYTHVARRMLDTLVEEGRLRWDGEFYAVPSTQRRTGSLPSAPRWIDPDDAAPEGDR